eukprot:3219071-Amphidinium_carterae.2
MLEPVSFSSSLVLCFDHKTCSARSRCATCELFMFWALPTRSASASQIACEVLSSCGSSAI